VLDVRNVHDLTIQDHAANSDVPPRSHRKGPLSSLQSRGAQVVMGDEVQQVTVETKGAANRPSHSRKALRTIKSKTGCTSVGELLIV
jgi:hypothetical protein